MGNVLHIFLCVVSDLVSQYWSCIVIENVLNFNDKILFLTVSENTSSGHILRHAADNTIVTRMFLLDFWVFGELCVL